MKQYMTNRLAVLLLLTVGLTSCLKEETLPRIADSERLPISITVIDAGYVSNNQSAKQIRATEANYTTTFVAGDKIGLYVVDKNGRVLSANLPLTYNGTKWTGSAYYGGMGAKYFAYYPYQLDAVMNLNSVTATAIDAAAFFENLIKRWNIGIDQDTESKYTAYDLMTGNGVVTGIDTKNLSLSLTHQMALAVIEMPVIHYSLSTDPTYTWTSLLPDLNFINFSPLPMEGGYRYLINPHNGSLSLIGSYTKAQQTMEFVITTSAKPIAAKYDVYTVDGGTATIINKSHILTVGDFYMNDGSLLPAATITLTTAQQAACLGVVYWVGDIKNDNYTLLNSKFLGATHGLVVALWNMLAPGKTDVYNIAWTYGGNGSVSNWLNTSYCPWTTKPTSFKSVNEKTDKMQGYANTIALQEYNKAEGENSIQRAKPIVALVAFESNHPAPTKSSGWYWPSVKELEYVCWGQEATEGIGGRNRLNEQFRKVNGAMEFGVSFYWSSAEYSRDNGAWSVDFEDGYVYGGGSKSGNAYCVRPLLAF